MSLFLKYYTRLRKNRFAKDSFWALVGNISGKGMALVGSIFVARFLGKEVFGEFGTIKSTLINFAVFSTFGLGYAATKFIAENRENGLFSLRNIADTTLKITLFVSALASAILFLFSDYLAGTVFMAEYLSKPIKIVSIWIIFHAITITQIGILSGIGAFKQMARINVIVGIISLVSSIVLAYYFLLEGALLALLATQLVNWFLNRQVINKLIPKEKPERREIDTLKLLGYSTPVAIQEGVTAFMSWLVIIILLNYGGYSEVGLYSAALQWFFALLFVPGILKNVILSHLSNITGDAKRYKLTLNRALLVNFLSTLGPALLVIVFFPLIESFYGNDFEGLFIIVAILAGAAVFNSLSNVFSQAFYSMGRNWIMLVLRLSKDIFIIGLFYFLMTFDKNGAFLMAICQIASSLFFLVLTFVVFGIVRKSQ